MSRATPNDPLAVLRERGGHGSRRAASWFGIASSASSLLALLLTCVPLIFGWFGLQPGGSMDHEPTMRFVALQVVSLAFGIVAALVGVILGVIGLFQVSERRIAAAAGVLLGALVAVGWVGYLVFRDL